ncbi:hypothetical protein DHX103_15080 [Planococcus sp. X10-3]|uniref:hypothetical protein n=1 Tax=Planococcus sp. X10-3 TaxID=3061240 RepID=UPI003BAE2DA7
MKHIKNQQGYALLVVLLMVVLFLGLSATFMAGSLSNAKQEQTVDASNQAVASAEMGVKYHSADLQREIGIIKSEIIEMTQDEIKTLVKCFNDGEIACDTQEELTNLEKQIDNDMKEAYIEKIRAKVTSLIGLENVPFPAEEAKYKVTNTEFIEKNAIGDDITQTPPLYDDIRLLEIKLTLSGKSSESTKDLKGIFNVEVPLTFLSAENKLTVETITKSVDLVYENIFNEDLPTTTCESIKDIILAGGTPTTFECLMGSTDLVKEFADLLKNNQLDPTDFTVYTPNFKTNVCEDKNNCNTADIGGVTVVVNAGADGLMGSNGNMNSFNNANLIINGHLIVDQFQNPGVQGDSQTIIVRELTVNKLMHGLGLENTNLLILGKEIVTDPPSSTMYFQDKVTIGDNGRVCFDLDRITVSDWMDFQNKVEFKNNNTTGQIIYYTNNLAANKFVLPEFGELTSAERTKLYVQGYDNYTNFLSSCGVNVSQDIDEITDIPVPYVIDPDFDLDVEY